jgi:MFS family permease
MSYRDFRVLLAATVLASTGFRAQVVVLGWLLLERSDSAFIVGLGTAVLMSPNALFGLAGGAMVDHYDRLSVLKLGAVGIAINALLLAAVAFNGSNLVLILGLTFLGGTIWSLQQTARQSYALDIVGAASVIRGLSYTTLSQRVGGIVGGLGAGAVIDLWGPGEAYAITALFFLASAIAISLAKAEGDHSPRQRQAVLANLREYTRELGHNRSLATVILLTAGVEILGFSHQSALPILARDVLGGGGGTLGLLTAVSSLGGIAGVLLFSMSGDRLPKGLSFLAVLMVFGVAIVLLGASHTLAIAVLTLLIVSAMAALSDVLSQSLVQLSVPNEMRGRAVGSWMLAIGIGPLGHLQIGALVTVIGVSSALTVNGVGLLVLAVLATAGVERLRKL